MFDKIKSISVAAANVTAKVAIIAAGVAAGTLAAAKITEIMKSDS